MLVAVSSTSGGDRLPVLKYDGRAGRIHLMDRIQDGGQWVTHTRDVTMQAPQFAVDFGSVEVGWMLFPAGMAPMMVLAPFGQPEPQQPPAVGTKKMADGREVPNNFQRGFRLKVAGKALADPNGGVVREFTANARVVLEGVNELHTAFCAAAEAHAGKIPVVRLKEVAPVKAGQSTNYKPIFEIVAWADRDDALFGARTVAPPKPGQVQAAAPAPVAAPPAPMPPPVPVSAALNDAVPF